MPETLTVTLPSNLVTALREAVAKGEYPDTDAAVADALTTWARREEDEAEELAWIKAKIGAAIHDPRPPLSLKQVDARLDAFFRNVAKSADDEAA